MLDFKPIELKDRAWMDSLLSEEHSRSADFRFNNFYLWKDTYRSMVCTVGDRLGVRVMLSEAKPFYFYPAGRGPLEEILSALEEDAARYGAPLSLWGVTEEKQEILEKAFPHRFVFSENRPAFDYVYAAEKLEKLPGKKLHGKRNHIRRFEQAHRWAFVPLTPQRLEDCWEMNNAWIREKEKNGGKVNHSERNAIRRALDHFEELGLEGGLLEAEGKVIGFTLGEGQTKDTFTVHFEKAFSQIQGAYPMINRCFVQYLRQIYPQLRYINREDDMGLENLRKAKESYQPDFLIAKYTAISRGKWE